MIYCQVTQTAFLFSASEGPTLLHSFCTNFTEEALRWRTFVVDPRSYWKSNLLDHDRSAKLKIIFCFKNFKKRKKDNNVKMQMSEFLSWKILSLKQRSVCFSVVWKYCVHRGYNLGYSVEKMLSGLIFEKRKIDVVIVQSVIPASEEIVQLCTQQFFSFCLERGVYLKWALYLFKVRLQKNIVR